MIRSTLVLVTIVDILHQSSRVEQSQGGCFVNTSCGVLNPRPTSRYRRSCFFFKPTLRFMFRFNCFWKAFSVYIVVVVGVFSRGANRQGRAVQGFDGGGAATNSQRNIIRESKHTTQISQGSSIVTSFGVLKPSPTS